MSVATRNLINEFMTNPQTFEVEMGDRLCRWESLQSARMNIPYARVRELKKWL